MDVRKRLLAAAAGSPIGDPGPAPAETIKVPEGRRRPLGDRVLKAAAISVGVLLVALVLATTAFASQRGHWRAGTPYTSPDFTIVYTPYRWVDYETGKEVESFKKDGKTYKEYLVTYNSKKNTYTDNLGNKLKSVGAPDWMPDGYTKMDDDTIGSDQTDAKDDKGSETDPAADDELLNKKISKEDPPFELSFRFFKHAAEKLVWSFFRALADNATSLGEWCVKVMTANANAAFTSDFTSGTFGRFYTMASTLSRTAFQPYAMAFLGLTFGVALMHQLDVRRKMAGVDIMASLAFVLMMFAVSYTLIVHAMDICALVYYLAQNLVSIVNNTLASLGIGSSEPIEIRQKVLDAFDALTYSQAGTSFILLILALVALIACVGCMFSVLTTIFLRVGEIYLRAAASPLCLSFFADDKSRHMGVGYLKRFAAVCFQAVMIVIAIGMIPMLMSVATDLVSPITSDTGSMEGFGDVVAALLPTMCAILSITGIVNQSRNVANGLFGLA